MNDKPEDTESEFKVDDKVVFVHGTPDPEFLLTFSAKGKTSMWRRRAKR